MTRRSLALFPALLLAACGGNDGGNDHGHGGGGGGGAVCTQEECLGDVAGYSEVDAICSPDGCVEVGFRDAYGEVRRGSTLVGLTTERADARTISSAYVRIFYPRDTMGAEVDCARILGTPDRLDDSLNVVGYYTTAIRSQGYVDFAGMIGPIAGLPVNDAATPYVVHVAMFSGDRDPITLDPVGVLRAEGCLGGLVVADGEAADWMHPEARYQFGTVVATAP